MPLEEVKGQIFSVTGVDGERFDEPIHLTGEVVKDNIAEEIEKFNNRNNSEADDAPADTAKTWEYVYYRTIDAMISQPEDSDRPPRYLPLPMTLCCSARKRDRTTHEFIVDPPAFSRDVVQAFWEATLGSFFIYGYLYEGSVLQHALVLLIRDVLAAGAGAEAGTTTVPCYVQDPGYRPEDESILTLPQHGSIIFNGLRCSELDPRNVATKVGLALLYYWRCGFQAGYVLAVLREVSVGACDPNKDYDWYEYSSDGGCNATTGVCTVHALNYLEGAPTTADIDTNYATWLVAVGPEQIGDLAVSYFGEAQGTFAVGSRRYSSGPGLGRDEGLECKQACEQLVSIEAEWDLSLKFKLTNPCRTAT
ncbi:hypothetical protein B0T24DRAFT_599171 [Lasiosphaeria ovina]|uniref:Uncharacterized protein n=1 Tax=Lasiosphaeria ovina TaxID=92902 RepID=A0AAE0JUM1_9PEZI|nr:hypothetical protein B0T24DRAFT_599171 [Lasiosphaeria ovina]